MALVSYYNPLAPIATKTEQIVATNTKQLRENIIFDCVAYDLVVAKNDVIIEEDCDILETDIIGLLLIPKGGGGGNTGKQIVSTIAAIAIMVYAPEMSAYLIGEAGVAVTAAEFYAITATIAVAGSMMVGAVLAPKLSMDTSGYSNSDISSSATYGWNTQTNQISQGDVVPRLYGTARIFPRMISKYVETIDDKQYLNMLYLVNEGYTTSISGIQINNEQIDNLTNVTYETRYGTNNQPIISRFDNIRTDKSVSKKISTSYATSNTDGDQVVALEVGVSFPKGLYYANDSGGLTDTSVKIIVEYSTDQTNWTQFGDDTLITAYSSYWYLSAAGEDSSYGQYSQRDFGTYTGNWSYNLPSGAIYLGDNWYGIAYTYSVDYTTITRATSSTFRKTFRIENLARNKYYLRAKFAEAPTTGTRYANDCYFEYITEEVGDDFTYPNMALLSLRALATDQLSGGMPTVSCIASSRSNNPALICKDMLINSGVIESRISSKFDEWADYCDDNNLVCDIYFDTKMSIRQALNMVSVLGNATVVQFGSKFDVIINKAQALPVQGFTFGIGNILKDTFKQSFLPLKDRANIIEATFYNAENDYQKEVFEISNSQFDDIDETNKASINLIGCTNKTQAIALAQLQLNYNNYITQTFTFQADADALYCKVGDIVRISHDIPQYGFSGRVVSCTTLSVVIDREVVMEEGKSYALQARRNEDNEIIEVSIINSETTTDTLTFATTLGTALSQYDNYSFGEVNKTDVKARVLSIRTDGDLLRELTCIEYNESVYDTAHTPFVDYVSALGLSNLRINDFIAYAKDRSIETVVNITWSGSSLYYDVSIDGNTTRVYDQVFNAYGLVDGRTYNIKVKGSGSIIEEDYTVIGKFAKPNPIDSLSGSEVGNVFTLTWEHEANNIDIDFLEYVVYYEDSEIGRTKNKSFEYYSYGLEVKIFTVKSIDTSAVLSDGVSINLQAVAPNAVSNLSIVEGLDDWELSWNYGFMPTDFKTFQIYQDYDLVGETTGLVFKAKITQAQSKFRVIAIDTAGNQSTYTEQTKTITTLSDITSVNSSYLNNNILMFWAKIVTNKTPIVYDIKKGSTWENGQFIESTTDYKTNIYSNGTYMVKPTYTFTSGLKIEAINPTVMIVDEAQLMKNVLVTWNEFNTNWSGTLTNTQVNDDGYLTLVSADDVDEYSNVDTIINFDYSGEILSQGIYEIPLTHNVSLAWAKVCTLSYNLELEATSVRNNFDTLLDVDNINAIDGYISSDFAVEVQIAISQDGINFGDYSKFIAGDFLGQAFKFRLVLSSFNQDITPLITNFEFTIDMPDLYEAGSNTSDTSSKTIVYENNFSTAPDVQITIVNATAGDDAILTNQTDESFDIIIKNSGTNVVRTFNYFVKGY